MARRRAIAPSIIGMKDVFSFIFKRVNFIIGIMRFIVKVSFRKLSYRRVSC